MIITATLSAVAAVASRIMNLENEALRLEAMRLAIKKGRFKTNPGLDDQQQM